MEKGKSYLIQVPGGREFSSTCIDIEQGHYMLKFDPNYSKKTKRIAISRFESGIACFEGTDHLIMRELK